MAKINFNPSPDAVLTVPKRAAVRKVEAPRPLEQETKEQVEAPRYVKGKRVTNIEGFLFLAADNTPEVEGYSVHVNFINGRWMPGGIEVDAVFYVASITFPVFVDGEYWHRTSEQIDRDVDQAQEINRILSGSNAMPVQRVPGDDLQSYEQALATMQGILNLEYIDGET